MVFSKTRVDARKAFRKLVRVEKTIFIKANTTTEELAKRGKFRAREIAPYYSGKTSKYIRVIRLKTGKGDTWMIQAMNPTKSDGHVRKIQNFNLVRWMHETNGVLRGKKHIKSGEPQFMYKTESYLNGIKREVAKGIFKNIRIK